MIVKAHGKYGRDFRATVQERARPDDVTEPPAPGSIRASLEADLRNLEEQRRAPGLGHADYRRLVHRAAAIRGAIVWEL